MCAQSMKTSLIRIVHCGISEEGVLKLSQLKRGDLYSLYVYEGTGSWISKEMNKQAPVSPPCSPMYIEIL